MPKRPAPPNTDATRALKADGARRSWAKPDERARRIAAVRAACQTPESRAQRSAASLAMHERLRALRAWTVRMERELFPPDEVFTPAARRKIVRVLWEFFDAIRAQPD